MALSRILKPKQLRKTDEMAEFHIPQWMNRTFFQVMRVEAALLHSGLRFPLGGSRILLARRKD
jgi:hypothetical protein